jgi:hypothetical protein
MGLERRLNPHPPHETQAGGERVRFTQTLVGVAERELERALLEQRRPAIGMYTHPSRAEYVAFDRAVGEICAEAHRLDLRAEELLVAIKQAWFQLITVRARHLGDRDGDVLRRVVSTSIEVFFQARDGGDPAGQ